MLPAGVAFLDEEAAVFEAMLDGWRAQRIGGRGLREQSVRGGLRVVRRFQLHCNAYPWQWSAAMVDEWMVDMLSVRRLAPSTMRGMQGAISLFCDYLCSPHYGWVAECERRFGSHPVQVCHDWNTTAHIQEYEGVPRRRPMTRGELQQFLDHIDDTVARRIESRQKGSLIAYRDATLFKVIYGWGLRASEGAGLDTTDFYRNPKAPQFREFGMLQVRHGKASRGSAPKRRNVASLFDWAVDAVDDYVENVWPLLRSPRSNALWVTERKTRMTGRDVRQ